MTERAPEQEALRTPRIVGVDSAIEREVAASLKEFFDKDEAPPGFRFQEHSPKIEAVIGDLNSAMTTFFATYGIEVAPFPSARVLLASDDEKLREHIEKSESDGVLGHYNPTGNVIFMLPRSFSSSHLLFASLLAHELIHAYAFHSFSRIQEGELEDGISSLITYGDETGEKLVLRSRRFGFFLTREKSHGNHLFFDINEAVTTELQIRFMMRHVDDLRSLDDVEAINMVRDAVKKGTVMAIEVKKIEEGYKARTKPYPYQRQREVLNAVIDDIYEKHQDHFSSREDVFKLFVDAAYKGQILPLARLVEETRGKGAFRAMGENLPKSTSSNESKEPSL